MAATAREPMNISHKRKRGIGSTGHRLPYTPDERRRIEAFGNEQLQQYGRITDSAWDDLQRREFPHRTAKALSAKFYDMGTFSKRMLKDQTTSPQTIRNFNHRSSGSSGRNRRARPNSRAASFHQKGNTQVAAPFTPTARHGASPVTWRPGTQPTDARSFSENEVVTQSFDYSPPAMMPLTPPTMTVRRQSMPEQALESTPNPWQDSHINSIINSILIDDNLEIVEQPPSSPSNRPRHQAQQPQPQSQQDSSKSPKSPPSTYDTILSQVEARQRQCEELQKNPGVLQMEERRRELERLEQQTTALREQRKLYELLLRQQRIEEEYQALSQVAAAGPPTEAENAELLSKKRWVDKEQRSLAKGVGKLKANYREAYRKMCAKIEKNME